MIEKLKKPNIFEGYNPTFLDKINEIIDIINSETSHNSSFIQDLIAEYHCPHCKETVNPNELEKWRAKGSPK